MSARESILARRLLGAILLAALAASALGIGPAAIAPSRAQEAGAQQVTSANITSLNTSRDEWGNIFNNTTTLLVVQFSDYVNTTANPSVNITFRLLTSDRSSVLCQANISLTPAAPGVLVLFYNTSIVVNATGIFYGNVSTGLPGNPVEPATQICPDFNAAKIPLRAIFQFVDAISTPARVLKELVFDHIKPSLVRDSLAVTRNASHANVSFSLLAPDLNAFWNFTDNYTDISFTVVNATFSGPGGKLSLSETGKNTSVFSGTATFPVEKLVAGAAYNLSLSVPRHMNSTETDVVNITFTLPPVPAVAVTVDWLEKHRFIPATVDNNLTVGINITDPTAGPGGPAPGLGPAGTPNTINITFLNYLGQPVKTNFIPAELFPSYSTTQNVSLYTSTTYVVLNAPLIFQYPFDVLGGTMVVTYTSPGGFKAPEVRIPIRAVNVSLTINGSQSLQGFFGQAINVTLVNPAASFNLSRINTVSLTVTGATVINGSPVGAVSTITLWERSPGSGVFTGILQVGDDANVSANPEGTITFMYVHNASASTPFGASTWTPQTVVASFRLATVFPKLLSPADGTVTGPAGTINVTIQDPNANRKIFSRDVVTFSIKRWDGSVLQLQATETGPSTGVFTALVDKSQIGSPAEILAGGSAQVVYTQTLTLTGPVTVTATVRFVSVDAKVTLDKAAYAPGDTVTITVEDEDTGVNTTTVQVTSTSDSFGVQVTLTLARPGSRPGTAVYSGSITVSNSSAVRGDPKFIYANVGDTITVSYRDLFPADYAATRAPKTFTATALVGKLLDKPISASVSPTLTFVNGTPATRIVTGQLYLVHYSLTNNNPVPETFTVIFQVLDPAGTPVQIVVHVLSLGPGLSTSLADSVSFAAPGNYTIKILIVRSLADLTPRGDPATLPVSVSRG